MSKKYTNKEQGKDVSGASLSSANIMKMPETFARGLGTSYAIAVSRLMDQASSLKGSLNSFLGVEKVILDPKEHAHSLSKNK